MTNKDTGTSNLPVLIVAGVLLIGLGTLAAALYVQRPATAVATKTVPGPSPTEVTAAGAATPAPPARSVALGETERRALNVFFSNFAEAHIQPFREGGLTDETLIQFGVFHTLINRRKAVQNLDDSRLRIAESEIESSAEKYFGAHVVHHKSLSGPYDWMKYQDGYYYVPVAEGEAYSFAQIDRLDDVGNGIFEASVTQYVASSGGTPDPQGNPASWNRAGENVATAGHFTAKLRRASDSTSPHWILLDYIPA